MKKRVDPLVFRNIFLGCLKQAYTQQEANKLIYFPTKSLLRSPENARSAKDFLSKIKKNSQNISPVDLYLKGVETLAEPVPKEKVYEILRSLVNSSSTSRQDCLTIVIIPGIFSEFIDTKVFEEVFSKKTSSFRSSWRKQLSRYRKLIRAKESGLKLQDRSDHDLQYSLQELGYVDRRIEDLIAVSSVDDKDGSSLINVITFKTERLSLESFGDTAVKADIFSRRLNKFFSILGVIPKNIAFLGYSRGTCVGLEMLSQAKKNKEAWLPYVRAMISMGGVTYGSELADESINARNLDLKSIPA